ncbi:response regulator [Arenibaculum pallidiluteum]|uniref:response regulator n=1 Tax=Arenibaculum pallidiluteum TaxID=2812559 RepID=UPI001A978286|nr:response regulator [Arenibaculum pallidiluteum]
MRILIVEDEALVALDLQECLERLGHEVVGIVRSAAEVRALPEESAPDVAFVDLHLGEDEFGPDIARLVRERFGSICLYVTGNAETAMSHRDGAFGVLSKPVADPALASALACLERIRAGHPPGPAAGVVVFGGAA